MAIRTLLRSLGFSLVITNVGLAVAASPGLSFPQVMAAGHDIHITQVMVTADTSHDPKLMGQLLQQFQADKNLLTKPVQDKTLSPVEINARLSGLREAYKNHNIPLGLMASFTPSGDGYIMHVNLYYAKVNHINAVHHMGYSNAMLRYYQSHMVANHQLSPEYEHYAGLARDIPGLEFNTYYQPSSRNANSYDMYTLADRHRLSGFLDVNNTGNGILGHYFFGGGFTVRDLLGNDALSGAYATTSRPAMAKMVNVNYRKVVGDYGTQIRFNFIYSYSKSIPIVRAYLFRANGEVYALSAYQPLVVTNKDNIAIEAGAALSDGENLGSSQLPANFTNLDSKERIPYLFAAVNFASLENAGRFWGSASITKGVDFANLQRSQITGRPDQFVPQADPNLNFTRLNVDMNQLFYLPRNWSIYLNGQVQAITKGPMPISQKMDFAEGAYVGQTWLGDYGAMGMAELRYDWLLYRSYMRDIQFFSYGAAGYLRNPYRTTVSYEMKAVQTIGVGLRFNVTRDISGYAEITKPFQNLPLENNRDWLPFFGLRVGF